MLNLFGNGLIGRVNVIWDSVWTESDPGIWQYVYNRRDERNYYLKDHLGSIRLTVNESGNIISAQDYYPYGEILRSYTTGGNVNDKYKFTEKERDAETDYDYFPPGRTYDSKLVRWLQVDPLTDKYPGWSPYNYTLNNPLKFIDQDGKAPIIDESQLNEKERKKFDQNINNLKKSERFKKEWEKLEKSNVIYKITSEKDKETGYFPNSNKKGSGGTLNIYKMDLHSITHESFHAFQHDNMNLLQSTGEEVEAYLFSESIGQELLFPTLTGFGNDKFGSYYKSLFNEFTDSAWRGTIKTFKSSLLNSDGRYNNFNTKYYNPTLIKQMYPLWR